MGPTVPLKSKLTVSTRSSRLEVRVTRISSLEDRVSSLEDRETRQSRIFITRKSFRGNDLFLEWRIKAARTSCTSVSRPP